MISLSKSGDQATAVASAVRLPRVDLLPPEIGERRRFRRVQLGLGGGVLASVGVVAALFLAASGSAATAQEDLDAQTRTYSGLQAETVKYRDVTAVYQRAAEAQAMLVAAMGEEVRYSRFLHDLSLSVPQGVWVTDLTFTQGTGSGPAGSPPSTLVTEPTGGIGTVSVSGVAYAHDDVAAWLESLAAQEGYARPYLQSSTEQLLGTKKVVQWQTTVELAPTALSKRYVEAGS